MIPATTPTFVLTLKDTENHLADTKTLRIDIRQQDMLLSKKIDDLNIETSKDGLNVNVDCNQVAVTLTQKESAKFLYKKGDIEFQLHGLMNDGLTAWKTYVVKTPVDRTLSKEVITNG